MVIWPGLRRTVSSAIQRLFNGASFSAPLTHSAVPTRAASGTTATFTRATTSTWTNNDGYLVTGVAGEIGFVGARRIYNKLTNTGWSGAASGTYGTVPTGWTADVGTGTLTVASSATYTGHNQITFTATAQRPFIRLAVAVAAYSVNILSVRVVENASGEPINDIITGSSVPAGSTETYSVNGSTVAASYVPVAGDVIEYKIATAATAGTPNWRIGLGCQGAATGSVTLVSPQLEDVAAQTTQTAGEYVSVGVASSPYYHGSMVDGVKDFETDLSGNPLPTSYTYDAVSLNGVAGTYVSTPDSAANSITGDIDIRVKVALNDWTPSAASALASKDTLAGALRDWGFFVEIGGDIKFYWFDSGGSAVTLTASAKPTVADGAALWLRVTLDVDNGAAGNDGKFYTSSDGVTWTQLGVTRTTAGVTNIRDSAAGVYVGMLGSGSQPSSGKFYQAQIYNGINGTLAVDFDASRYAGGTTLTGSTGETWTLQGNAKIHATNNPLLGYQAEGARTNLCLQSNAFTTAPWGNNGPLTLAQDATGPDGGTTAWTITDDAAGTIEFLTQYFSATAANYTFSIRVKKTTGAQSSYPVVNLYDEVSKVAGCTIDTTNGIATVWTGWTGLTIVTSSASCVSYNDDYWRVSLTALLTAATWRLTIIPAATTNATQATGEPDATVTGSAVFYGAQVELGSFASSYIPTTTIAVARNADVLTYSSAGNILGTVGAAYAEVFRSAPIDSSSHSILCNATVNRSLMVMRSTTALLGYYDGTNDISSNAPAITSGATNKVAISYFGSAAQTAVRGTVSSSSAFDGNFNVDASIEIGNNGSGTGAEFYGNIRNVRIWQRALSSSELQAVTA